MTTPKRNYAFIERPDKDYTIDFAAVAGRKEVSVVIEITDNNKLEITVKTNRVDDYEIQYSEFSVDVSDNESEET